jgi:hypothetical protein
MRRAPALIQLHDFTWLKDYKLGDGSSGGEGSGGKTQPLLIRLHRAVALASSHDPSAGHAQLIRHVCGNKKCATCSHYRTGTKSENELDNQYHKSYPSRSRQDFGKVQ